MMPPMARDQVREWGASALMVIGIILLVAGAAAFALAEGGMVNYSEVNTARIIGGVASGLGLVLVFAGRKKK